MNVSDIKALQNKATIKHFEGRISSGSPPKDPTPQQQRFGEHTQSIIVEDKLGDEIEVRLMRTQQHLKSSTVGHAVVFEAGEDKDGKPTGLRVEKWSGKNGEMCILAVDAKHGARTYVMDKVAPADGDSAAAHEATARPVRYQQSPGSYPANLLADKLEWCWKKVDYVESDDIRQRLATTLFIEMSRNRIDVPPVVAPDYIEFIDFPEPVQEPVQEPAVEQHTPEVQHEETPQVQHETEPEPDPEVMFGTIMLTSPFHELGRDPIVKALDKMCEEGISREAAKAKALDDQDEFYKLASSFVVEKAEEEPDEEYAALRDELIKKYGEEVYGVAFKEIAVANDNDVLATIAQIKRETKDFKTLLFEIAKAVEDGDDIPF